MSLVDDYARRYAPCEKCGVIRSLQCDCAIGFLKVQLAQQADLLWQALGAIVELTEWIRLDMIELQQEGHVVSHLASACDKAQALIPKIRAALDKLPKPMVNNLHREI